MLSWNSNTLSMWRTDSFEKTLMLERLKVGGEGDNRGWDGWMSSPTQWTWVWVNSGSWWWTGRAGMLRFMGSQRVRHDWATEQNWTSIIKSKMWTTSKKERSITRTDQKGRVFLPLGEEGKFSWQRHGDGTWPVNLNNERRLERNKIRQNSREKAAYWRWRGISCLCSHQGSHTRVCLFAGACVSGLRCLIPRWPHVLECALDDDTSC